MSAEKAQVQLRKRSREGRELEELASEAHRAAGKATAAHNEEERLKRALGRALTKVDTLEKELEEARESVQEIANELDRTQAKSSVLQDELLRAHGTLNDRCEHKEETPTHLAPDEEPQGACWPAGAQKEATWNRIWAKCDKCTLLRLVSDQEAANYLERNPGVAQHPPAGEAAPRGVGEGKQDEEHGEAYCQLRRIADDEDAQRYLEEHPEVPQ